MEAQINASPDFVRAVHTARQDGHTLYIFDLPLAELGGIDAEHISEPGYGRFVFRALSFTEFDHFSASAQIGDITDMLIQQTLMYPVFDEWDKNPINKVTNGSYEETANTIIEMSGFESAEGLLSAQAIGRTQASSVFGASQMFICRAFPGMRPDIVANMGVVDIFRMVGMAEHMLSQEGEPAEFPLAEFLNPTPKRGPKNDVPTWKSWDDLPVYDDRQLAAFRSNDKEAVLREQVRRKRQQRQRDPAGAQAEAVARRREQAARIHAQRERDGERAMLEEGETLRQQYGRG